jgi:hypothetical protein
MTNHKPMESESFVRHFGKKKKGLKIISWKKEYKKREKMK